MELFSESDYGSPPEAGPVPPPLDAGTERELCRLAGLVRASEPWTVLRDQDILGFEDPETGELSILSVLGLGGEVFSLHLHHGPEGLRFWDDLIVQGDDLDPERVIFQLRVLECGFVNKGEAEAYDVAMRLRCGKAPRQRKAWPAFRSYRPGFFPWPPEEGEARALIRALRLFLHFQEEFIDRVVDTTHFAERDGRPVIPALRLKSGGNPDEPGDWNLEEAILLAPPEPVMPEEPEDELFAARLASLPVGQQVWEIGATWLPTPVAEGERPFFPRVALCVSLGEPVSPRPVVYGGEGSDDRASFREAFTNLAEDCGQLPAVVRIDSDAAEAALRVLARERSVRLSWEDQELLPMILGGMARMAELDPSEDDLEALLKEAGIDEDDEEIAALLSLMETPPAEPKLKGKAGEKGRRKTGQS